MCFEPSALRQKLPNSAKWLGISVRFELQIADLAQRQIARQQPFRVSWIENPAPLREIALSFDFLHTHGFGVAFPFQNWICSARECGESAFHVKDRYASKSPCEIRDVILGRVPGDKRLGGLFCARILQRPRLFWRTQRDWSWFWIIQKGSSQPVPSAKTIL